MGYDSGNNSAYDSGEGEVRARSGLGLEELVPVPFKKSLTAG